MISHSQSSRAFSLVELLVATAVLALVLVLTLRVTDGILAATGMQSRQMNSAASARQVADILAADLRHALVAPGAGVLVPSSTNTNFLAMVTGRRGPDTSTASRHLAVAYAMDSASNAIVRRYAAVPFDNTNLAAIAAATASVAPPPVNMAEGILAVRLRVKTLAGVQPLPPPASVGWASTNAVPPGWRALVGPSSDSALAMSERAIALEVWIATVDPQTFTLLQDLPPAKDAAESLFATTPPNEWRSKFDQLPGIPSRVKSSLRILNKTIALP